jgi:hypothetical protein
LEYGQPPCFIVHYGDTKDPTADLSFLPTASAEERVIAGDDTVYPTRPATSD